MNVLLLLIHCFIIATSLASRCAQQKEDEMDACAQKLFVLGFDETRSFPTSESQLNVHCSEMKSSLKCVKRYSNDCMDTVDKPLLDMVIDGSANEIRKFCIDKEGRKDFIQKSQCYNRHITQLNKCMQVYLENLHVIPKAERSDKIPLTCCEHCKFKKCMEAVMNATCDATEVQYMLKMVDGSAISVFELMCGQITEKDEICENLPDKTESDKISKSKSIIYYLHTIYKSIMENPEN